MKNDFLFLGCYDRTHKNTEYEIGLFSVEMELKDI